MALKPCLGKAIEKAMGSLVSFRMFVAGCASLEAAAADD